MKFLRKLTIAAMCSTAFTAPAIAQGAEETAEDKNVILVTATRRAEDVQDIPLAVTAVSPEQLEQQGVVNIQNVGSVSPSFSTSSAQTASGSVVLRIRGVGTTSNNIGFESAVGIFVDGAYQSRPGVALSEFVDVERVEILRGPQGTLFGRNTSAGALNITNKRPDVSEFGGFVNATYASFDTISLQGAINAPIIQDQLAVRLTGAYRERDGYLDVIDRNDDVIGESNTVDQYLLRGQLGYESESGIEARLIADYSKSTAGCCSAVELLASPLEGAAFAAIGLGPRGGQGARLVRATSPFDNSTLQDALDDRNAGANFVPRANIDQWGITGEISIPIGDNADLIYIGSYRDYSSFEAYDSDFTGIDVGNVDDLRVNIKTLTQELRLQGEAMDGRLSWLVGGYYADEDLSQEFTFSLGEDYGELIGALLLGATAADFPPAGLFAASTAVTNAGNPLGFQNPLTFLTGSDPAGTMTTNAYAQSSKSWSIFTHNTFDITDRLNVTLGLRWSDESKDGSFEQPAVNNPTCNGFLANGSTNLVTAIATAGVPVPAIPTVAAGLGPAAFGLSCLAFLAPADSPAAAVLPLPRSFDSKFKDDELIYTAKVGYELDNINLYASFTHGYKSGGFNLDSTAAAGGADPRFRSEKVDAYEVGLKGKFLDNAVTLNIAAFHQEFSNFQVLEFTGAQFTTFNVPTVLSTGVEIESVIRPSDNFTFNGGLTWTDARYPNDCAGNGALANDPNVLSLCGNSLTNAPEIVAIAGASYERELGNSLKMQLSGQIRFEGDRRTSTQAIVVPDDAAIAAAGSVQAAVDAAPLLPFDVQDGNAKINLRASIGDANDRWAIEGFVTNLTNKITRGVTFNTLLRSGSRSAFVQEPRIIGLTVRGKF